MIFELPGHLNKRWFCFREKAMLLEEELIYSLRETRKTWKNEMYLEILKKCNINYLCSTKIYDKKIKLIDAFATSFEDNPYKDFYGKYERLRQKIYDFLLTGRDTVPNYIDEATIIKIVEYFLHGCYWEKKKNTIKNVPPLVWAVSTQNMNLVKSIVNMNIGMQENTRYGSSWGRDEWFMSKMLNSALRINISLQRLREKKEYVVSKYKDIYDRNGRFNSDDFINKIDVFDFIENYNNVTPLILACKLKNVEIASFLISKGASLSYKDMYQKTAYDYAVENDMLRCASGDNVYTTELAAFFYIYFVQHMGESSRKLKHYAFWDKIDISKRLKLLDSLNRRYNDY